MGNFMCGNQESSTTGFSFFETLTHNYVKSQSPTAASYGAKKSCKLINY